MRRALALLILAPLACHRAGPTVAVVSEAPATPAASPGLREAAESGGPRGRFAAAVLAARPGPGDAAWWAARLDAPAPALRRAARDALVSRAAATAVPSLLASLPRVPPVERAAVAKAVLTLDPSRASALEPDIAALLTGPDAPARDAALALLPDAGPATAALVRHVARRGDAALLARLAPSLAGVGSAARDLCPAIRERLTGATPDDRVRLLALLAALDPTPAALADVRGALASGDPYTHTLVAEVLAGSRDRTAASALLPALVADADPLAAARAALALKTPNARSAALRRVAPLARSPGDAQAEAVTLALKLSLERADEWLDALRPALGHSRDSWRRAALSVWLRHAGPRAPECRDALAAELRAGGSRAAAVLEWFDAAHPVAPLVADAVAECLSDRDARTRRLACRALTGTPSRAALDGLAALVTGEPAESEAALSALARLAKSDAEAAAWLAELPEADEPRVAGRPLSRWTAALAAPDPERRFLALQTLATPDTPEWLVPAVAACVDDAEPDVRVAAASTLGAIGTPAARQALRDALPRAAGRLRVAVAGALLRADAGEADALIPVLNAGLKDADPSARAWAARALETLRPAPIALPATVPAPPGSPPGLIVPR